MCSQVMGLVQVGADMQHLSVYPRKMDRYVRRDTISSLSSLRSRDSSRGGKVALSGC